MSAPAVTVCIPVYNGAAFIRETLDSVLRQDFGDFVIAVSDNASEDGTLDIVREYSGSRLQIYTQERNIGMVANWQFLVDRTDSEFFCILGADDIFYPAHLGSKIGLLEKHPSAPFAHGAIDLIGADGAILRRVDGSFDEVERREVAAARLLQDNFVNVTSAVVRTQAVRRKHLQFDPRFQYLVDWQLWLELTLQNDCIVYDSSTTAAYRVHQSSIARQNEKTFAWFMEQNELLVGMIDRYRDVLSSFMDPKRAAGEVTAALWMWAFKELRRGNARNAGSAWALYRKHHSPLGVIPQLPGFIARGLGKQLSSHTTA